LAEQGRRVASADAAAENLTDSLFRVANQLHAGKAEGDARITAVQLLAKGMEAKAVEFVKRGGEVYSPR
jgi:hypothetical protein